MSAGEPDLRSLALELSGATDRWRERAAAFEDHLGLVRRGPEIAHRAALALVRDAALRAAVAVAVLEGHDGRAEVYLRALRRRTR